MLELRNLRFSYGRREVLRGVNLRLEAGELVFLLGGNGAGKTTLFRCILGLLKPDGGEILIDGEDARRLSPREMAKRVAYIPQTHNPVFSYSVLDMVLMGTDQRLPALGVPGKAERQIAMQALRQLGMEEFAHRSFHALSGGEQQLVLIARALAQQAKILLMDEPTSALDYGNQLKVLEQAVALAQQGYTVLLSCHNPQLALLYARRAAALYQGVIAVDGPPEEALSPRWMSALYGVAARFVQTEEGTFIAPMRRSMSRWTPDMLRFMQDAAQVNRFHEKLAKALLPLLPTGGSFCDAGCGIGRLALAMAPHYSRVVAADLNENALAVLRASRPPDNVEIRCCDILRERQAEPFDVMAFCFFGHTEEILQAARRQCRGTVVIVRRAWRQHRFSLAPQQAPQREDRLLPQLQQLGVPYDGRRLTFDMGQPFRSLEDAVCFFRLYSHDEKAAAITEEDVQARLRRRDDPDFPWYLPMDCQVNMVLIRAEDLPCQIETQEEKENMQ